MNTITTTSAAATATTEPILAFDLGKYKSVACVYRSADEHCFITLPTSCDPLARLITKSVRKE